MFGKLSIWRVALCRDRFRQSGTLQNGKRWNATAGRVQNLPGGQVPPSGKRARSARSTFVFYWILQFTRAGGVYILSRSTIDIAKKKRVKKEPVSGYSSKSGN
jgi:hypothetical protein